MATFLSNTENGYTLQLDIGERPNSIDVGNNSSIVDWALYLHASHAYFSPLITIGNLYIAGNLVWAHNGNMSVQLASRTLLHTGGMVIPHKVDGTQDIGTTADFRSPQQGQAWTVPQLSIAGNIGLSRIPRGPRVKSGGKWRHSVVYVKQNGVWRVALPYVRSGGQWKLGGG